MSRNKRRRKWLARHRQELEPTITITPGTPAEPLDPDAPKRILFVDDRKDRYETLCKERPNDQIIWADGADKAVAYLVDDARAPLDERYSEIHLDFNLIGEADGLSVVHALGCLNAYYCDAKVVCHSTMKWRREEMRFNLLRYSFDDIDASTCFDDVPGRRPKYEYKPLAPLPRYSAPSHGDAEWWLRQGSAVKWDRATNTWLPLDTPDDEGPAFGSEEYYRSKAYLRPHSYNRDFSGD